MKVLTMLSATKTPCATASAPLCLPTRNDPTILAQLAVRQLNLVHVGLQAVLRTQAEGPYSLLVIGREWTCPQTGPTDDRNHATDDLMVWHGRAAAG